jgi:hypothetical protein
MRTNTKTVVPAPLTHEGAIAARISAVQQLRRSVMACMLFEKTFYESGTEISDRIAGLLPHVLPIDVQKIAIEARTQMKLRHAPLLIVREMARLALYKCLVADTLVQVIQRADELAEFLSLYWKDKRQPVSAQVKKGLAKAFLKFSEYELAKWNRDADVKLKDVAFLCHVKPKTGITGYTKNMRKLKVKLPEDPGSVLLNKLIEDKLETPDTWEVELSASQDKKQSWIRLLSEGKIKAMALLKNLRNMLSCDVPEQMVIEAIEKMDVSRVLPFRFISAAQHAMVLEPVLERAMFRCVELENKLPGKTIVMVDVSGSMSDPLSSRSTMTRMDAACGIAMLARELCEDCQVFTFSNQLVGIPPRRGFALRDAIVGSQSHQGTYLSNALLMMQTKGKIEEIRKQFTYKAHDVAPWYDRIIVITDEQSHDGIVDPLCDKAYAINVGTNKNGVGYGRWLHIDGFSEATLKYIQEVER